MMEDKNQIEWDNVLDELEKRSEFRQLTAEEKALRSEILKLKGETASLLQGYRDYQTDVQWDKLKQHLRTNSDSILKANHKKGQSSVLWTKVGIAAAVLFLLAIGLYFVTLHPAENAQMVQLKAKDILPGSNKAILTLANNKKIILSDAGNEDSIQQGNTIITKKNGSVYYLPVKGQVAHQVVYNTIATPRGGVYQLTLADGTQVKLNANSSITYPTSFSGTERKVSVNGELYFEVAHNKNMPFKVVSRNQTIEVLGTHFNLSTYPDDPSVKTTLLEGSVKVTNQLKQILFLRPGQQAQNLGKLSLVPDANAEAAVSWTNGFFHFENADISTIMREFSRWYDVDVDFVGKKSERRFTGDIHRDLTISNALEVLSYLKIHFTIEEKKIIVTQ